MPIFCRFPSKLLLIFKKLQNLHLWENCVCDCVCVCVCRGRGCQSGWTPPIFFGSRQFWIFHLLCKLIPFTLLPQTEHYHPSFLVVFFRDFSFPQFLSFVFLPGIVHFIFYNIFLLQITSMTLSFWVAMEDIGFLRGSQWVIVCFYANALQWYRYE